MPLTLPRTDTELLAFLQNFYTVGNPIATSLGLTSTLFTALNSQTTTYQTALGLCAHNTRNKVNVEAKNTARAAVKNTAKQYVSIIDGQPTVSNATKLQLGINVRKPPTPSPIPATAPVIEIKSVSGFTVNVRLRGATGSRRGKPANVAGASFFSFIGAAPPTDISQWKFEGNTGIVSFPVTFANTLSKGTTVWFTAFWFNGAKNSGPMSAAVNTILQGGGVTMTEAA